jgi:hypothetical protein
VSIKIVNLGIYLDGKLNLNGLISSAAGVTKAENSKSYHAKPNVAEIKCL